MTAAVHGIHHITCIAGDPQQNVDFYTLVLGLRLVKRSVNQDVPDTYHLFYADGEGTPGTDLTFFPWPEMDPVHPGAGLAMEVSFAVRPGSLDWWRSRFTAHSVEMSPEEQRFGERVLPFRDPHGLHLALVETERERPFSPWKRSSVDSRHQLRGLDGARLVERDGAVSAAFLTEVLGFAKVADADGWSRYSLDAGAAGSMLDVREQRESSRGRWGTGGVHHIAWRVSDAVEQAAMRERVSAAGRRPTPVIDRFWFQSVYFVEPGGVLFELATDGPGFERDEAVEALGERLILPPWLEPNREEIEGALPALQIR